MERIHGRAVQNRLNELDDHNGVVRHPEPDIPEWEVKQALRSTAANKANGCHEIPAGLFKSLKDDAIKVLHSLCPQIWKTQQWPQDWQRSILIPIPKKGSIKECAGPKNCHWTITLISYASKVMLKILHSRLCHYAKQELSDVQAGFRKGRGTRDQIANIYWIIEKAREFQKNFVSLTMQKPLTLWLMTNWKVLREIGIPDHLTCLLRNLYMGQEATVRTLYGTTDWFKIEKEVQQGCLLSPRKAMTNLNTVLKSKDVTLLTKVHIALTIWSSQWSHMVVRAGP